MKEGPHPPLAGAMHPDDPRWSDTVEQGHRYVQGFNGARRAYGLDYLIWLCGLDATAARPRYADYGLDGRTVGALEHGVRQRVGAAGIPERMAERVPHRQHGQF